MGYRPECGERFENGTTLGACRPGEFLWLAPAAALVKDEARNDEEECLRCQLRKRNFSVRCHRRSFFVAARRSLPHRTSSFNANRKCQAEGIVGTRRLPSLFHSSFFLPTTSNPSSSDPYPPLSFHASMNSSFFISLPFLLPSFVFCFWFVCLLHFPRVLLVFCTVFLRFFDFPLDFYSLWFPYRPFFSFRGSSRCGSSALFARLFIPICSRWFF